MGQLYGEFDFLLINVIEKVVPTKISTLAVMISKTDIITHEIFYSSRYENYLTAKQKEINARYIIYRIVNCVSVIWKLCHSGMVVILVNNSSCGLVVYRITTIPSWHTFVIFISRKHSLLFSIYVILSSIINAYQKQIKVIVMVERLFLTVPRGCLQFVIVVFPDHTHLLFLYDIIH